MQGHDEDSPELAPEEADGQEEQAALSKSQKKRMKKKASAERKKQEGEHGDLLDVGPWCTASVIDMAGIGGCILVPCC